MRLRPIELLVMLCALWLGAAHAGEVRILVQSSPLAGFKYHAGEDLWPELREGDRLGSGARARQRT
jgi:hypothetical protein